ncbi:MAG TPA: rhamnulokinase family protein [Terriglobia bacterium]|nr:rhamnulokinase family protein [Terriglobia bacterium]
MAIDLGAESCRVSLAEWNGARANVRLVHRYPNRPVERDGHLYWDLERICKGAEEGLRLCAAQVPGGFHKIDSIGVDGWAVDYVRLDSSGQPLGDPFCYRDLRTETAMPEVWARIGREKLYELTGIQFLRFNTLYQLYADVRDGLSPGDSWLNIPEYLLYRLAGSVPDAAVAEYTNATHTQLIDVHSRTWRDEIFEAVGLRRSAAPRIIPPGTRLGLLQGIYSSLPTYKATELIAPACHDTGSAIAGIPDADTDWAFISSGTWSLVGRILDEPCTSAAALHENFTNEGGIGGKIRFLKNVNGMWLLQECMRSWASTSSSGRTWNFPELIAACQRVPAVKVKFNVDAPDLIVPGNMPSKINRELEKAGSGPIPEDADHAPEMANIIFASLAARYAEVLHALQEVTGSTVRRLYVVGGASQNEYLNRLIAGCTGLDVIQGSVESSTVGNLAVQYAMLESESAALVPASVARWAGELIRASSD